MKNNNLDLSKLSLITKFHFKVKNQNDCRNKYYLSHKFKFNKITMLTKTRLKSITILGKRNFLWGSKTPNLMSNEEEMKIMQYRGRIEDFSQEALWFELYMRNLPVSAI